MRAVSNHDIEEILLEIAIYLDMQGVAFKPRAYEKVAEVIGGLSEEVSELYKKGGSKALEAISGVGISIAEHIEELLKTGRLRYYEELKKKTPVELSEMMRVEGLGPKSIKKLYEKLKIKNLKDLEVAARKGKIALLEGFGAKKEENILKSIEFFKKFGGRAVLTSALPQARQLEEKLGALPGVQDLVVAGSLRRRKETIGDIDILVIAKDAKPIMDYFVSMPEVARVLAHGDTKSSVTIASGLDVDLRVVDKKSYGAALNYFTGSKDHNVALRTIAIKKGHKLNEYGLWKGPKQIGGQTEEDIYKALGMDYVEPEMRENTGEIEAAQAHKLPKLIGYDDLRGDLQVQTDWTDGMDSIEEMARVAIERGLEYIAITDHTKRLAMTNGLDEKRIVKQWAEIDRVNKKFAGKIKVLKGTECDILKDGSLDLTDEILAQLDVVGVSVHSYFNLPRAEQTARMVRAMENKHVDILFHPTGRIVGAREAYDVDMDVIIGAAKRTGTILEANGSERLDLKDEYIRKAIEAGVKIAIDSDAHTAIKYSSLEYGIAQARRGWAEKKDVINAWPLPKMMKMLKGA